jgi:hypothetical protein
VSSADLVPGDIIVVPPQFLLPCDLLLINGQCVLNESMLTGNANSVKSPLLNQSLFLGESVPVLKTAITNIDNINMEKVDPRHVLFGGTKIVELRVNQSQQGMKFIAKEESSAYTDFFFHSFGLCDEHRFSNFKRILGSQYIVSKTYSLQVLGRKCKVHVYITFCWYEKASLVRTSINAHFPSFSNGRICSMRLEISTVWISGWIYCSKGF